MPLPITFPRKYNPIRHHVDSKIHPRALVPGFFWGRGAPAKRPGHPSRETARRAKKIPASLFCHSGLTTMVLTPALRAISRTSMGMRLSVMRQSMSSSVAKLTGPSP